LHSVEKQRTPGDKSSIKKSKEKKLDRVEENLKEANQKMQMTKMGSMFVVMFATISLFAILTNVYDGVVVAKLPFEPLALLT
jgi:uncharacterized membrane protein (DUF106 family)